MLLDTLQRRGLKCRGIHLQPQRLGPAGARISARSAQTTEWKLSRRFRASGAPGLWAHRRTWVKMPQSSSRGLTGTVPPVGPLGVQEEVPPCCQVAPLSSQRRNLPSGAAGPPCLYRTPPPVPPTFPLGSCWPTLACLWPQPGRQAYCWSLARPHPALSLSPSRAGRPRAHRPAPCQGSPGILPGASLAIGVRGPPGKTCMALKGLRVSLKQRSREGLSFFCIPRPAGYWPLLTLFLIHSHTHSWMQALENSFFFQLFLSSSYSYNPDFSQKVL